MDLKLIDESGKPAATLAAPDSLFGRDYNEALIHQVVTAFQANARSGNRAQKSRGEINKSHKKPWQQKGTGRARAGQANSPLWRGGGKIFPSSPDENFSQKVNRKMYRAGVASILSQLVREGRLSVIEQLALDAPKTKLFAQKIKALGFSGTVLVVNVLTGTAFGAIPLLRVAPLPASLHETGRGNTASRNRHLARHLLMGGQVALALGGGADVAQGYPADGAVGKRLGFLAQEIGREVNTMGAKAGDAAS